jgi:FkbM family methyltransferase
MNIAAIKHFVKTILTILPSSTYQAIIYRHQKKLNWNNLPDQEYELLLLKYFLTEETVFFDVGANAGVYSYQASHYTEKSNIYAFEPIPDTYKIVKKALNKINLYNLAFSNAIEQKRKFKIPIVQSKKLDTRGTLNTEYAEIDETTFKIIEVNTTTLDEFIKNHPLKRLDYLKIDVEGHENEVIKGGTNVISSFKPILQVEIEQRHHPFPISDIIDSVKELGYKCYYFDNKEHILKELNANPSGFQDIKAIKTKNYTNNFYFFPVNKFEFERINEINSDLKQEFKENQ